MTSDDALQWFYDDAKRLGLSLAEYEFRFGIILSESGRRPSPLAARIRRNEVPGGVLTDRDLSLARHKEQRRRRSPS